MNEVLLAALGAIGWVATSTSNVFIDEPNIRAELWKTEARSITAEGAKFGFECHEGEMAMFFEPGYYFLFSLETWRSRAAVPVRIRVGYGEIETRDWETDVDRNMVRTTDSREIREIYDGVPAKVAFGVEGEFAYPENEETFEASFSPPRVREAIEIIAEACGVEGY